MAQVDSRRVLSLNKHDISDGPVVYWMYREHRVHDNWALLRAQEIALKTKQPLIIMVAFRSNLSEHSGAARWFNPMTEGLEEVATQAKKYNISFSLLVGNPQTTVPKFLSAVGAGAVICDFSPLKYPRDIQRTLAKQSSIAWECVDAHNIVPCWIASQKQEFAARTFRPKVHKELDTFLVSFPNLQKHPFLIDITVKNNVWKNDEQPSLLSQTMKQQIQVRQDIAVVDWFKPGEKAAENATDAFIADRLLRYSDIRNDPTKNGLSNMSPYLHFGHIAPARLVQKILAAQDTTNTESVDAFIEEVVVRRELSDNYCFYTKDYTSVNGLAEWAQTTLQEHSHDEREHIYTFKEFEDAQTHDLAWNAAQQQLLQTGKMHGYMRMYWAKKMLEWTKTADQAIEYAIKLNDLYELDGRDPNGYVGILWSIGGLHDRAWFERPVFGKVRYMNANGLARKFDLAAYTSRWTNDLNV